MGASCAAVPASSSAGRNSSACHGVAAALSESSSRADGTYRLDKENGFIYVYANRFSTYAIGYTQCYNIAGAIQYGDFTGDVTVSLLEGEDEKLTAYDTVSLSSGVGAYRFTHIPKGTYTLTAKWFEDTKEITLRQEIEVK